MIVRDAQNDVGELDARGLDRERIVAEVGRDAFPGLIEGFKDDLQRLGPVRRIADEFACSHGLKYPSETKAALGCAFSMSIGAG